MRRFEFKRGHPTFSVSPDTIRILRGSSARKRRLFTIGESTKCENECSSRRVGRPELAREGPPRRRNGGPSRASSGRPTLRDRRMPMSDSGNTLDAVIAEYLQSVEAGQVPNRQDLL